MISVRFSEEVVAARVACGKLKGKLSFKSMSILRRRTYLTGVCSITVDTFQGWTVPVDDLVTLDETIRGGRSGLERSNEWLSHVKPGILKVGSSVI
jgi:hypothetical protein